MKPLLLLPLLALAPVMNAEASSSSVGTASVPFLLMPAGARAVAMGGSGAASAEDATAMLWNPALLAKADSSSVSLMHAAYLQSSAYDYAALGWKPAPNHAFGVSVQYFSAGDINSTDDTGKDLGTLRPYDMAAALGYAFRAGGWSFGASVKGIQSKIINTGKAVAADAGFSPPDLLEGKLRLGASVSNLGGKIRYDATNEKLSSAARAGARLRLYPELTLSADAVFPNAGKIYAAGGLEAELPIAADMKAALRAGYSTQPDSDGFSGACAGAGFKTSGYSLDYAFAPFGALGNTHRFSLTLYWGRPDTFAKAPRKPAQRQYAPYPGYKAPTIKNSPSSKRRAYRTGEQRGN